MMMIVLHQFHFKRPHRFTGTANDVTDGAVRYNVISGREIRDNVL